MKIFALLFFMMLAFIVPAEAFDMNDCKALGQSLNWDATNGWTCQQRSVVSKTILTTDISGNVTFAYPITYSSTPAVTALPVSPTGAVYVVSITSQSATSVTLNVKQNRSLPATLTLLTALVSYDIFGGAPASGVTLNIFASGN